MKKYKQFSKKLKRVTSLFLALLLTVSVIFPYISSLQVKAEIRPGQKVTLTSAYGDIGENHKLYCIDKGGLALWGIADAGDEYEYRQPWKSGIPFSQKEQEYIFWGMLTIQAAQGDQKANQVIDAINTNAIIQGKTQIENLITEEDLKSLLYMSSVRNKYKWLETIASNTEDYLKMGGLIGGNGGSTIGGKKIPDVIANNVQPTSAYQISNSNFTIQFDPSGSDKDFIQKVPIEFSNDNGITYRSTPTDGWTYTKNSTNIIFSNPNSAPPKAMIKFNTEGTQYNSGDGSYVSELALFEACLQVWVCTKCSGTHGGGTTPKSPLEHHQRLVWIELQNIPVRYYASLGGDPTAEPSGADIQFQVFRHEEDFTSNYNLQLYKYDAETGKPLDGARFVLYERFDDQNKIDTRRDGLAHIYAGGAPYASYHKDSPAIWDGFRKAGTLVTDSTGHAAKTVEHGYHYDKTFCDGHPAPTFISVPEPEEGTDELTGESTGEILNSDEIEGAKTENRSIAEAWINCVSACETQASGDFEGVHFHWMMSDVDSGEIESVAGSGGDEGSTPDGGNTSEPDADTAYEKSGCYDDMKETYDKFISLKYSYAITEFQARDGYIRHDLHADDVPIEIITTDSSENGANAAFAGTYSNKEKLEVGMDIYSIMNRTINAAERAPAKVMAADIQESEVKKTPKFIYQKVKPHLLNIVLYDIPELEDDEMEDDGTEADDKEVGEASNVLGADASEDLTTAESKKSAGEEPEASASEEPKETKAEETKAEEIKAEETNTASVTESRETAKEVNESAPETSSHKTVLVKAYVAASDSNAKEGETGEASTSVTDSTNEPEEVSVELPKRNKATASDAVLMWKKSALSFRNPSRVNVNNHTSGALFDSAYNGALTAASSGVEADPGSSDNYSHCNNTDREGEAWCIYDHRTEGEFHINKKDLDLVDGESENYSAYGDTQGDGTLEGAVYGLFAAEDISHPDGKTGIVYRTNNLVSVATTDKNGDASFLVSTEAPGYTYNYAAGSIQKTADGWAVMAPKNLYVNNMSYDDYTEDGAYKRTYRDNEKNNGNCWIGRPILMGDYYVKELGRSEGYELSIGNKQSDVTNLGEDMDVQAPEVATGYAVISGQLFADEQTDDKGEGAGADELFFSAKSKDTTGQKYDILLSNLPAGMELYRKDVGTKEVQVTVGTGTYEKLLLTNQDGSPKYLTAENDYQYPMFNADGNLMTVDIPTNYVAERFRQVAVRRINADTAKEILERAEGIMTEAENAAMLTEEFTPDKLLYVKGKLEAVLRRNGKQTPRSGNGGTYGYSSIYVGEFDNGVRVGDPDAYGISGVTPGSPAAYTVYGSPVQNVSVEKQKDNGDFLTVGDAILSVLNYYDSNPFYSYGGIDGVEDLGSSFAFTIYASVSGNPENFMVLGSDPEKDSIIFHEVKYIPSDTDLPPRYIYADYSNNPHYDAFGTYENYKESMSGTSVIADAALVTDAAADQDGNLKSRTIQENVYYKAGELVRDEVGNLIQAFKYREITRTEKREVEDVKWVKLPVIRQIDGTYVARVTAAYTDSFGVTHTNTGVDHTMEFKAVLREKTVTLSEEDAAVLGAGFTAGHVMNSASYYVYVKKARAKTYLDYSNTNMQGDNTYIVTASLAYEKQDQVYQDAGTRNKPKQVLERAIRQKVKIVKDIQTTPEGSYAHNTNAASKLSNFRFKIYLKSNIERLYRNTEGTVTWLTRDGAEIDVTGYKAAYPEKELFGSVQKLYTRVLHKMDSNTTGGRSNNVFDTSITANTGLYSYGADELIGVDQNSGYTRLLETIIETVEDGAGKTRQVENYNYEKFFDAIQTANHDKWDRNENGSTSFKPFAYIRSLVFGTGGGEKENPAIHNNGMTDNRVNTSDLARDNALRSDSVRQFAITWYLKDEVKKLQEKNGAGESQAAGGNENYQEEVYDEALQQAILKTENYLKPFFTYDLDEIYAIEWDSETEGGTDKDKTTLSADTLYQTAGNGDETSKDGYFYGVSKYLPYGAYVMVEQQPFDKGLNDFYNKHYKIGEPKELILPAVYEPGGNEAVAEFLNTAYEYQSSDTPEEFQRKYFIRLNEEWAKTHTDDLRKYVIRARNADGDFEVYKYGLETNKLTGTITYGGGFYSYNGFSITQEAFDPYKDIYEMENTGSDYKSNQTVKKYYHYGSVSEDAGISDNVRYQHGAAIDDNNPSGMYFKDNVKTMTGALTAYDGLYAASLVPWTITEPADSGAYAPDDFTGYADGKFINTFYTSKLRIEKLDSETGENILHDGAVFALYSANREEAENSDGCVKFHDQDTVIKGSKEFLEAMGAQDIMSFTKIAHPWGIPYLGKYYGTVSTGTPVCLEAEQIVMKDALGAKTGEFRAFTTTGDLDMNGFADQNVGYLTTPQPLGAGCYVLAEIKAPVGYVRSKPVAIEIYSDETAYYLDGNKDSRVVSAVYEEQVILMDDKGNEILNPDGTKPTGNKPQDRGGVARVYFNNTPIRLEVSKVKSAEHTASYELSGRLEGSITELKVEYGLENLELAYNASGKYLGYGWKKGFLDSLKQKQTTGENIEILYEDGVFTGKAKLTKELETADDVNRYILGATMTLYDAVEVHQNGDSEDYKYDGVNVERDRYGNVQNIYLQKGYAGTAIKYVLDKTNTGGINEDDYKGYHYDQQEDDKGGGIWTYKTIEREDTDILFFDLGSLDILTEDKGILYSHDRTGRKVQVKNGESIFALKNGTQFLEIVSTDYENLKYNQKDRRSAKVPEGTKIYHLDSDGNRDSEVDPDTGMAFVIEEATGKILTWPVQISKDQYGNIIAREKIKTSRIAEINADTKDAYTIGTYDSGSDTLEKTMNPILNVHGQPVYYQRSGELYKKGRVIYDRDGDYVRYKYSDSLKNFNDNAYQVNTNNDLKDIGSNAATDADDKHLYHRQGESYLIENTWTTGEKTPNDPFQTEMTAGQVDVLKRVAAGTYIMEELKAPEGYVKTIPVGLTVSDSAVVQTARVIDNTINGYIEKLDAPAAYKIKVIDKDSILSEDEIRVEGKGSFTYQNVVGTELSLFKAKRVSTSDLITHPSGYYLVKVENALTQWTTEAVPKYLEAIPKGDYILEETEVPSGYIRSSMEIEIKEQEGLQHYILPNDHTKTEIFKYMVKDGKKVPLPNNHRAELALYEAITDNNGIVMENGVPKFKPNSEVDRWLTEDGSSYINFFSEFESLYREYGSGFDKITWQDGSKEITAERIQNNETDKKESVRQLWKMADGSQILVQITKNLLPTGYYGLNYDYKLNYKHLAGNMISYDTPAGNHRIDYLPFNGENKNKDRKGYYVLVETRTPEGFAAVKPKAVVITETENIQLYALENEPKYLCIQKISEDQKIIKGAELALYKAAEDGSLVMDAAHLMDQWISDDLKPHYLSPVPYGTYYLTELMAPPGYEKMEPQKIEVTADSDPFVKAVNTLKKGILKLEKSDTDNSDLKLSGAKFKVTNQDTGENFYLITDDQGQAESEPLPIGTTDGTGMWKPYHYEVCEVMPPETYQLNLTKYLFSFEDKTSLSKLTYHLSIPNKKTRINITKSDFASNMLVEGAYLAIYGTKVINGHYEADGEALESWLTDQTVHTVEGKLAAGRIYMLKELKAPSGYHAASPVLFTISEDGRRITAVTNNLNMVNFKTSGSYIDAVESVTVSGRQAIATVLFLTDLETDKRIEVPAGKNHLTAEDGLIEGHLYEEKEVTHYSDGNKKTNKRTIFRLSFDQEGQYPVNTPMPEKTVLCLETKEGEPVEAWLVENKENEGYSHTIFNPEYEEGQSVQVVSTNGRYGTGVIAGSILCYEVSYRNNEMGTRDIKLTVTPDPQTEYMPANSTAGGKEHKESVTWTIRNVSPGESGSIKVTAALREDAKHRILMKAVIGEQNYVCENPVALGGGLTVTSTLSGTAREELENTEFEYEVHLLQDSGEPLKGICQYFGSKEGTLKSGDTITLKGGEFITITGMAWGTHYEVAVKSPEGIEMSVIGTKGMIGKQGATAVFLYKKNDGSIREVFKKCETYHLTEKTIYSDGSQLISDKLSFTLNENAAIGEIDMKDQPTQVRISKTNITGGSELPGAHLVIRDEAGNIVKEWISTNEPQELTAELESGKTYFLTEIAPPHGYVCAETIEFTVSKDGGINHVRMEDKMTCVEIVKTDESGEKSLRGAFLEVRDKSGKLVERWVSNGTPHRMTGKLEAGEIYTLKERKPPSGYWKGSSIDFKVPTDGELIRVQLKNKPTRIYLEKRGYSTAQFADQTADLGMIGGAKIGIYNEMGKLVYLFMTEQGVLQEITGILNAGETYTALEIEAPEGYSICEPVTFMVPESPPHNPEGGILPVIIKIKNIKKPVIPDRPSPHKPDKPEPEKTLVIGTVTVEYVKNISGRGGVVIGSTKLSRIPWLGDRAGNIKIQAAWCLLVVSVLVLLVRKRRG